MATKATLNLRIDKELKERLTEKLKTTGETATDVITRAIEAYCNDVTLPSNASNASVTLKERVASLEEKQEAMAEAIALQDEFTSKLNEQLESLQCNAVTLNSIQGWACPLLPVTQSSNAVTPSRNDDVTQSASPPVTTGSNDDVTIGKGSVITSDDTVTTSDDERDYDYSRDTVTHPSNDTVTTEKPPSEIATEEVNPTGKDKSPSEISKTPEEAKTVAVEEQGENSINYSAIEPKAQRSIASIAEDSQEDSHSDSLGEESAIAPPKTPEKELTHDEQLLDAINQYISNDKKALADKFVSLLIEYGIEEDGFKFPKRSEARYIKSFLGLEGKPRPKEGTKYRRAADILLEAYEIAQREN